MYTAGKISTCPACRITCPSRTQSHNLRHLWTTSTCPRHIGYNLISSPEGITVVNTLRPRQNGRHFPDDNLKRIFLNENVWFSMTISLKFVPRGPINNIPALVQIMAWRRPGDKPLSGPMMVRLPTHICVTRPPWVNAFHWIRGILHYLIW